MSTPQLPEPTVSDVEHRASAPDPLVHFRHDKPGVKLLALAICRVKGIGWAVAAVIAALHYAPWPWR